MNPLIRFSLDDWMRVRTIIHLIALVVVSVMCVHRACSKLRRRWMRRTCLPHIIFALMGRKKIRIKEKKIMFVFGAVQATSPRVQYGVFG